MCLCAIGELFVVEATLTRIKKKKSGEEKRRACTFCCLDASLWGNVMLSISRSRSRYSTVSLCSFLFTAFSSISFFGQTENELLSLSNFLSRFYLKVCNGIHITCKFSTHLHTHTHAVCDVRLAYEVRSVYQPYGYGDMGQAQAVYIVHETE